MKNAMLLVIILCVTTFFLSAQTQYQSLPDDNSKSKILKGLISKELIASDSSYDWYAQSRKIYMHPDSAIVNAFKRNKDKVRFVIFGGTWCEDTQFILPKFFMLQEMSGIDNDRITLFGVDRKKQTTGNIAAAFNITNVPTIIVMKDGKETGRVVEFGTTGKWDAELAEILNRSF